MGQSTGIFWRPGTGRNPNYFEVMDVSQVVAVLSLIAIFPILCIADVWLVLFERCLGSRAPRSRVVAIPIFGALSAMETIVGGVSRVCVRVHGAVMDKTRHDNTQFWGPTLSGPGPEPPFVIFMKMHFLARSLALGESWLSETNPDHPRQTSTIPIHHRRPYNMLKRAQTSSDPQTTPDHLTTCRNEPRPPQTTPKTYRNGPRPPQTFPNHPRPL